MASKQSTEIEKLADEIADMIISSRRLASQKTEGPAEQKVNQRLEGRLLSIEKKVSRLTSGLRSVGMDFELHLNERVEEMNRENEEAIIRMQGELDTLRGAMIRLKNDLRQLEESLRQ